MPCYDSRSDGSVTITEQQICINELTRLLCSACKILEKDYLYTIRSNKKLNEWWLTHKKVDERREAEETRARLRERRKQEALKKLSADERRILGLE